MKKTLSTILVALGFSTVSPIALADDKPFLKGVKSYYLDIQNSGPCIPSRESLQQTILPSINSSALVPNDKDPQVLLRLKALGQPDPKTKRCYGYMKIEAQVIYWDQPIPFNDQKVLASQTLYTYEHIFSNMTNNKILDIAQFVTGKFLDRYSQHNR